MGKLSFDAVSKEYGALWAGCEIDAHRKSEVMARARKILASRPSYDAISRATGVPWYVIGIIHDLEAGMNFKKHLHNGDPLTARTKLVPAGRPKTGEPPFTFEESAVDALVMKGLDKVRGWSIERIAYTLECYNGWGYRPRGIHSPYLWSWTNHYTAGKYIRDHVWSSTAVSQQAGGMALLKALVELDPLAVDLEQPEPIPNWGVAEVTVEPPVKVAAKSWSVRMTLLGVLAKIADWLEGSLNLIPDIQVQSDAILAPLQSLGALIERDFSTITTAVVVACAIVVIVRHTSDKTELQKLKGESS